MWRGWEVSPCHIPSFDIHFKQSTRGSGRSPFTKRRITVNEKASGTARESDSQRQAMSTYVKCPMRLDFTLGHRHSGRTMSDSRHNRFTTVNAQWLHECHAAFHVRDGPILRIHVCEIRISPRVCTQDLTIDHDRSRLLKQLHDHLSKSAACLFEVRAGINLQ